MVRAKGMFMHRSDWLGSLCAVLGCGLLANAIVFASDIRTGSGHEGQASFATESLPITSLLHRFYGPKERAPGQVYALAQTSDGFLWLGTPTGLVRFDGTTFENMSRQLLSPAVHELFADDADLWIGYTFGGIGRLHNGKITNFDGPGLPGGSIVGIARRAPGELWAASSRGLAKYTDGRWRRVDGHPMKHIITMIAIDGSLWVEDVSGFYYLPAGESHFRSASQSDVQRVIPAARSRPGWYLRDDAGVELTDADGTQWQWSSKGFRRARQVAGRRQLVEERPDKAHSFSGHVPFAMLQDREGNVWVGTDLGLDQFYAGKFVPVPLSDSVLAPAFVPGGHGDLWVGDSVQATVHVGSEVSSVPGAGTGVLAIFRDRHGAVWTAGDAGLTRLKDGKATRITLPSELLAAQRTAGLGGSFQALTMDSDDGLWLSVAKFGLYRWKDGVWRLHGGFRGLPAWPPLRLLADTSGRVWFTYPGNRVAKLEHGIVTNYTAADGLAVGNVLGIHVRGERVWVSGDLGVAHLEGRRFVTLRGADGETFLATSSIVETPAGELWMDGAAGVYRISADETREARRDPMHPVAFELFDPFDGLRGASMQLRPGPTLQLGPDGRLWDARLNGISSIDPGHIRRNTVPPTVSIEGLHVADAGFPPTAGLVLPKLTRSLRLDYTAASLTRPDRVRFSYQLEGVDNDWQNAGSRRQAFYTNLGPGQYRFRVRAANEDGLWSRHDAVVDFRIAPAFYQTWWFDLLCGFLAMGVLWLLYLMRLRQQASRTLIRIMERERIARDLHDTLLQGVQGLQLRLQTWAASPRLEPAHRQEMTDVALRARDMLIEGRDRIIALRRVDVSTNLASDLRAVALDYTTLYPPVDFVLTEEGAPRPLIAVTAQEVLDISREGLRNAFVHASARLVELSIEWQPGVLQIRVRDDGCGIDEAILREGGRAGHWGLLGMRERAAKIGARLDLQRYGEGGTELRLIVPGRKVYAGMQPRLRDWLRRFRDGAFA
ncbi:MAG TPA: two-component regulator propeller domain-containing protein [Rhodanobacter sp.]|nr:two-component regulator propeller domain-containing protein [Rhodanobacter sp.]